MGRLAVVVALALVVALGALAYRRRVASIANDGGAVPRLPEHLRRGPRTWVIFTTELCVSCDSVEANLRGADPSASVVRVAADRELSLAEAFRVRTAPTVLLADSAGEVQARLVGPRAVDEYLRADRADRAG